MIALIREYKGDGENLSVHHPNTPGAKDDAPDATALALLAGSGGGIGEILSHDLPNSHSRCIVIFFTNLRCAINPCTLSVCAPLPGKMPNLARELLKRATNQFPPQVAARTTFYPSATEVFDRADA
jgi:hypothetical protein